MFLATTALSEFWDTHQEILFLGSWCLRYDRRDHWSSLAYQVMPSPWNDRRRFFQAAAYLDACGERFLLRLTDYLNAVHQVSYQPRYWRILIGPWLLHFLHAAYDRYVHVTDALQREPSLTTVMLELRHPWIPPDLLAFIEAMEGDAYNLQFFSQLFRAMGLHFPSRAPQGTWLPAPRAYVADAGWKAWVRAAIARNSRFGEAALTRVQRRVGEVGLFDLSCPSRLMWQIVWRTRCRAFPLALGSPQSLSNASPRQDGRRTGLSGLAFTDEFERIVVALLPDYLPSLYLEGFEHAIATVRQLQTTTRRMVLSASGWLFHEPFKFFAAEASERGARLLAVQHGGGYGIYRLAPIEDHERRVADAFVAWGWADPGAGEAGRNLPRPNFETLLRRRIRRRGQRILFVSTAHTRYLYRFHASPVGSQWPDYLDWQVRFLRALPQTLRARISLRPYQQEYGHAFQEQLRSRFPNVRWDTYPSFYHQLLRARTVVIDHPGTTFLEALVANVPTVLFWDANRWEAREEAQPYLQELRRVGVLHDSPEDAADALLQAHEDPWRWWKTPERQDVRKRFVRRYALARATWAQEWSAVLKEQLSNNG